MFDGSELKLGADEGSRLELGTLLGNGEGFTLSLGALLGIALALGDIDGVPPA